MKIEGVNVIGTSRNGTRRMVTYWGYSGGTRTRRAELKQRKGRPNVKVWPRRKFSITRHEEVPFPKLDEV